MRDRPRPSISARSQLLARALICAAFVAAIIASPAQALRLEAESFATASGTVVTGLNPKATSGGAALRFDTAGEATSTFDSPVAQLNIVARGGTECSTAPTLQVTLDGKLALSKLDASDHWRIFKVPIAAPAGMHTLSVAGPDAGCGRPRFDYVDVPPPGGPAHLVFDDEFNGSALNGTSWHTCFWWSSTTCSIPGNNEEELYTADSDLVSSGALHLTAAKRDAVGWDGRTYHYTSGLVSTGGRKYEKPPGFTFTYGYAEARVKVPKGKGFWPAFWMLPASYNSRPEIDILEARGSDTSRVNFNVHFDAFTGGGSHTGPDDLSAGYHTYAVDWTPSALVFYVDAVERWRYTGPGIPAEAEYLLLNLAVGGDYDGSPDATTPFPTSMDVDWVRVWQRDTPPASTTAWTAFSATSWWNRPAAQKGTITTGNPYASQLGGGLVIAGTPDNATYATPVNFAKPGDPTTTNVTLDHADWQPGAASGLRWDGGPIPIPSPCTFERGSDGHLTIVSADRTRDWEFWQATSCSASGIHASVIASYDLTGSGVSNTSSANTARGSGTPLVSTSLRPDEVVSGASHTLGVSVTGDVCSSWRYPPASHSDGGQGGGCLSYGDLLVLRPGFPETGSPARINLIRTLKTYGVVVIDRASGDFELEASNIAGPDGATWAQAGLSSGSVSDIAPSDWLYVW